MNLGLVLCKIIPIYSNKFSLTIDENTKVSQLCVNVQSENQIDCARMIVIPAQQLDY